MEIPCDKCKMGLGFNGEHGYGLAFDSLEHGWLFAKDSRCGWEFGKEVLCRRCSKVTRNVVVGIAPR